MKFVKLLWDILENKHEKWLTLFNIAHKIK